MFRKWMMSYFVIAVIALATISASINAQPSTILFLNSQPGDYVGGGITQSITPAQGTFSTARPLPNTVAISFRGFVLGSFWDLAFAAPMQQAMLVPGVYEHATRWPFQASTDPGLDVGGDGRGCNTLTGRFEVLEVIYGPNGEVVSFAADFEQHCEGATPALFGAVRFNSSVPTPPTLGVTLAGTGSGIVTSNPAGISCPSMCSATFDSNTSVTLSAIAASDSIFTGWSGEGCSGTGTCTVSMTQARSVTATFGTQLSRCLWGLYIDDHHSGSGWESRLFLANLDTQHTHAYEVFVLATTTIRSTSLSIGPSGIAGLTCSDLQACGQAGWLYVQSDAPVFGATLFVINTVFGGGAFTAQTPVCQFGVP